MRNKLLGFSILLFLIFLTISCFAQEMTEIPEFTKDDRILVLAPHPDDESIGAAGVLQRALKAGAQVKIVCFTNGDANQLSFILYEKRLTIRKKEILHMGEVRRKETMAAMGSLGIFPDHIIFLGYPDFGTLTILTQYWAKTKPYKSLFTRVAKVSYPEAFSPHAPYVGESILKDLKAILFDFKPTKIFVSHPADTNRDHRALYLFLQIALLDLKGHIQQPEIFPYLIHVVGWPKPRGYYPQLALKPSGKFGRAQWQKLSLTEPEIKAKHDAIVFYKSQLKGMPHYLFTFARANELFGDYPFLRLHNKTKELDWQSVEGARNGEENASGNTEGRKDIVAGLAYALSEDYLWVRINTKTTLDRELGVSLYLLGYNKKKDFATMPKIHISFGALGVKIKDKKSRMALKDFKIAYKKKIFILKIPLSGLGHPDYILSNAHATALPYETTAWRILQLEFS